MTIVEAALVAGRVKSVEAALVGRAARVRRAALMIAEARSQGTLAHEFRTDPLLANLHYERAQLALAAARSLLYRFT